MRAFFYLFKQTERVKVGNYLPACLVTVKSLILSAVFIDVSGVVKYDDVFKVVTQTGLVVVRVVRGCDLHTAGAEFAVNVFIRYNGYLASDERENERFAHKIGISFIVRSDRNGGVAEHGLGTCRRNGDKSAFLALYRVFDVPEGAFDLLVLDLGIGNDRVAVRAYVRNAQTAVDKSLVVKGDEYLAHGVGEAFAHRERLAAPVAGGAELFELADYTVAVLLLPVPNALEKLLASEIVAGDAFVFAEVFLDLYLRGDAGMVCAGYPKGVVALHALGADENVLKRFVKGVPHVELSRDVGRRDNDAEGRAAILGVGRKIAFLRPHGIYPVLKVLRIIDFREFVVLFHFIIFLS